MHLWFTVQYFIFTIFPQPQRRLCKTQTSIFFVCSIKKKKKRSYTMANGRSTQMFMATSFTLWKVNLVFLWTRRKIKTACSLSITSKDCAHGHSSDPRSTGQEKKQKTLPVQMTFYTNEFSLCVTYILEKKSATVARWCDCRKGTSLTVSSTQEVHFFPLFAI